MFAFEKLNVWKESRSFVSEIYNLTGNFPNDELFGLTNQIRRASISISLNIAEGSARKTAKDQANFYRMAYSSATEVLAALLIAVDLGYLNLDTLNEDFRPQVEKITSQLNALVKAITK